MADKDYKKLFEYSKQPPKKGEEEDKENKIYREKDLYEFYEARRFTVPFMVYRLVDYWHIFDKIAEGGHIVNNLIVILIGIYSNVSFYLFFNLLCICIFYSLASYRVSQRARLNQRTSGLQT